MFSADGKLVYGIRSADGRNILFSVDIATGVEKVLGDLGKDFSPSNSPRASASALLRMGRASSTEWQNRNQTSGCLKASSPKPVFSPDSFVDSLSRIQDKNILVETTLQLQSCLPRAAQQLLRPNCIWDSPVQG